MNEILKNKTIIDARLKELLSFSNPLYQIVIDGMEYSLSIGGKRIRPCLVLEFARLMNGKQEAALDMACAIEMIHTYSLIHDDLPCMDNDDMRRGMPSCHKKFGEDMALLSGDALLTYAFSVASNVTDVDNKDIIDCIKILSDCAGVNGMIGGQVIDLLSEEKEVPLDVVIKLNALKTSKLLEASCMLGCAISGAEEKYRNAAKEYAYNLGIAFQIVDDILDVIGDEKLLGKPIGSDKNNNKSTFVSLLGLENAKKEAKKYTEKAISSLEIFCDKAADLKEFALLLLNRNH